MQSLRMNQVVAVIALLSGLVFVSCGDLVGEARPREGSALNDAAVFTYGTRGKAPNQRFVLLLNDVANESEEPVVIKRIKPLSRPDPDVAKLERIELAPRREDDEQPVIQGVYLTYPPASSAKGVDERTDTCAFQEVRPVSGYVLEPIQGNTPRAVMVMTIRLTGPGRTIFSVGRVFYEQNGEQFWQDVELEIDLRVKKGGKKLKPAYDEVPCMDKPNLVPQPGG